jgi:hypothetical protein
MCGRQINRLTDLPPRRVPSIGDHLEFTLMIFMSSFMGAALAARSPGSFPPAKSVVFAGYAGGKAPTARHSRGADFP